MSKTNDGEKKKNLKKQLVSGGIYIALAAAIVTVTLGSVSKIMNGDFGYEAPNVTLGDGNSEKKIVLPNIVGSKDTEVSGVEQGVNADVKNDKDNSRKNAENDNSAHSETKAAYPEQKSAEKPGTGNDENAAKTAEEDRAVTGNDASGALNPEVGEVGADYPQDPDDALFDGRFYKVADGYINREYSVDELIYSPTMKDFRTHSGVDITGDPGSPVRLFTSGTVTEIYNDASFGKTVAVDHGDGITAHYSNLSQELPQTTAVGAALEGGAVVGAIGCTAETECADVSHVHLEIMKDGVRIDPKAFLASEK